MKHAYLLLFALFSAQMIAQNIEFTDPAFKTYLINITAESNKAANITGNPTAIDTNNDDEIQLSEALNISRLSCSNNDITSIGGIENFTNLKILGFSNQSMETFNLSNLINLEELFCYQNNTSNLVLSNLPNLKYLICSNNNMTTLDVSGLSGLEILDCGYNNLSQLNLPSGLKDLRTNVNQLTSLDLSALSNLQSLSCTNNNLSYLNITNLTHLNSINCNTNLLTTLALNGLDSLASLNCRDNLLTSINIDGAPNLAGLDCTNNSLTTLDFSTNHNVISIYASNNNLTTLDISGCYSLSLLNCNTNQLSSIDISNSPYLHVLDAGYNQLEYLNIRNGYVHNPGDNPFWINISTLNPNPPTLYVCVDEDEYPGTIEIIQGMAPNTLISPYCTFSPAGIHTVLSGTVRYDVDNNGCNNNDVTVPFFKIPISFGMIAGAFIADITGNYSVPLKEDLYTIFPINPNPAYYSIDPQNITLSIPNTPGAVTQDFCISALGVFNDLEISIIPTSPAQPGFDATYRLIYKNKGTTALTGATTLDYTGDIMDYVSSTVIPDNIGENTLTWNFTNLQPFEERVIDIIININSPAVNIDDELIFTAAINTVETDETPLDNIHSLNQIVVGSFDPNNKTCVEGTRIHPDMAGEYVTYLIRFENTGTNHAKNIVVKDVIDPEKFEISSLMPLPGSHTYFTKIKGDTAEFIFENIMLPGIPSETRYGYIAFKIKTKATLQPNESFSNTASIYFDYNSPILTNEAVTEFVYPLGTEDFDFNKSITIYPNPAENTLYLNNTANLTLEAVEVHNLLRQAVILATGTTNLTSIDISSLAAGTYIVKVTHDKGTYSGKFIKK